MSVTIYDFEHLRHAEDAQLQRELEYRRIARERGVNTSSATARALRSVVRRFRRAEHARPERARPAALSPSR